MNAFDYDPMVYDAMRELGNQLAGYCVHRSYDAPGDVERQRWRLSALAVSAEINGIDPHDEEAVRTKTTDFADRLRAERAM